MNTHKRIDGTTMSKQTIPNDSKRPEVVRLPDGALFPFWDDRTEYRQIYHVSQRHPRASDNNPGTANQPWETIGRAAAALGPAEKVVVHEGVYRECVLPRRGGTDAKHMVAYTAASGERVVVTGSDPWAPECRPSEGWPRCRAPVWMADLPVEIFAGYNPFLARNMYDEFVHYSKADEIERYLLRRGAVFVDGKPLRQVFRFAELRDQSGLFWIEDPGYRIHFRLPGDASPGEASFEITAREQVFAPRGYGLGYIRVSGFIFERAADGVPVPQRALVSTGRGHHWIVENNCIREANACGLDVGNQDWKAERSRSRFGGHIIRGNTISDCGVCGIAGCQLVDETLVEDNVIERIGGLNIEGICESAGLKFHGTRRVLIRRNRFRHIHRANGIWLDFLNANCRITGNLFHDIDTSLGAVFIESSRDINLIDNNVFVDIRRGGDWLPDYVNGAAMCADSDRIVVARNFFVRVEGFAVSLNDRQPDRVVGGATIRSHNNRVAGNVFRQCPRRIFLGRNETNRSDGNIFDTEDKDVLFGLQNRPGPEVSTNFDVWRKTYAQDTHSTEAPMNAGFDPVTGILRFSCDARPALCANAPELGEDGSLTGPAHFALETWKEK